MLNSPFPLCVTHAANDLLYAADGRPYIDLFSAHGTTFLGHTRPDITAAVADQLRRVWITGGLPTPLQEEVRALVQSFFPEGHQLAALYSTGMEAAEFALRLARVRTGKRGAAGFARCMHGKSLATAYLGWPNLHHLVIEEFHRLPFVSDHSEEDVLGRLEATLRGHPVGAVFLEPVQGCDGARRASPHFCREVHCLCEKYGALLIFDELLTGFYRTGQPFYFSRLGFVPDVVLVGKAMGNGFPVSGVVAHQRHAVERAMLPGSTFAGNPLAAAATAATLRQFRATDLAGLVTKIETIIQRELAARPVRSVAVRGLGALWAVELPPGANTEAVAGRILDRGVAMGFAGPYLRLLPAATITAEHLHEACAVIHDVLREECHV